MTKIDVICLLFGVLLDAGATGIGVCIIVLVGGFIPFIIDGTADGTACCCTCDCCTFIGTLPFFFSMI
jgi:hypothetical protein